MSFYVESPLLMPEENRVLQLLAAAWNEFVTLPRLHPMEQREMCELIHRCQDKVMSRPVLRELNHAASSEKEEP